MLSELFTLSLFRLLLLLTHFYEGLLSMVLIEELLSLKFLEMHFIKILITQEGHVKSLSNNVGVENSLIFSSSQHGIVLELELVIRICENVVAAHA